MNVFENMAFSLRYRGAGRAEIARRVNEAARILEIEALMERMPRQLSGGQRQRVAMGRAIVRDPKVFLFDEPLSNLDAKLRVAMRTEIKRLRQRVPVTTVYVTHDQVEAMTLADRIVILNAGNIEQIGTPEEVYDSPATTFVAAFIGAPPMNLVPARLAGGGRVELAGGCALALADGTARRAGDGSAREVIAGFRPEHLVWAGDDSLAAIVGEATVVEPLGSDTLVSLDLAGTSVMARLPPRIVRRAGERVALAVDPEHVHVFDRATERRV
jgi:ABC-type sugar transport system ATPase subunit